MNLIPQTLMQNIASSFDAASVLPALAAEKLEQLRDARDRALDLADGLRNRTSETFADLQDVQRQLGLLRSADPMRRLGDVPPGTIVRGFKSERVTDEHPQMAALLDRAERLRDRHQKLQAELEPLVARGARLRDLVERIEQYVADVAQSGKIAVYDGAAPKATATLAAVERARTSLEALRIERERIAAAPRPMADVRRRIEEAINEIVSRAEPDLGEIIEPGGTGAIIWPRDLQINAADRQVDSRPDAIGLLAWLARDALAERLFELAEKRAGGEGLTDEERSAQLAEIDAKILAAERIEEACVVACVNAGIAVERRRDADPRAVLALADDLPAPGSR